MNIKMLKAALAALVLSVSGISNAGLITFDTSLDLTNNFNTESSTHWKSGYSAQNGFDGSDGGFVHFNSYDTSNSLQFINGPVFLNGFDISSQHAGGGDGVSRADNNGRDYILQLFDVNLTKLYEQTHLVASNGSWEFVNLNIANVYVIKILPTWSAVGVFDGFWPNLDNITYNSAQVPEPSTLAIFALGIMGLASRRFKK